MKKIRILIADDHSIIRKGLTSLFRQSPQFSVIGEAASGEEVIELVRKNPPDVAILDLSMPGIGGIEAVRVLKRDFPNVGVLILTIYDNEEYVYEMVSAGANGYVLKDAEREELYAAVQSIHAGKPFFSPRISRLLIDQFIRRARVGAEPDAGPKNHPLTVRELEILRLIAAGMSNPKIARKLFLSVKTVNTHRANIMHKLEIHEVTGLVRYAIQNGLVTLER
jgi:DNA-binding NarL/FixJ family response regulator